MRRRKRSLLSHTKWAMLALILAVASGQEGDSCCQRVPFNVAPQDPAPAVGACCVNAEVCQAGRTQEECRESGGAYHGDDSSCESVQCLMQPTGACCYSTLTCEITTPANCTGTYLGDGTVCNPSPCPGNDEGACCFPQLGVCTLIDSASCGGNYLGDGVPCTAANCPPPPQGACCTGQACIVTPQLGCDGVYLGDGTVCMPDSCQ
jgi:hypothetical protein